MFFDGDNVEEVKFTLEPGKYNAIVSNTEQKPNSKGTGELTVLTFQIEGESNSVDHYFNLTHNNQTAQNIARSEFKKVVEAATGSVNLDSLEDLVGKRIGVNLVIQEVAGKEYNRIGDFFKPTAPLKSDDIPF